MPRPRRGGGAQATRLIWSIRLNRQGGIEEIEPLEQRRGLRGWGKPKAVPLPKLAGNEKLEPWDARVARAIRQDRYHARRYTLDRAAAIVALIGHPAVAFADAPETMVDVVEGAPELEVVREGDRYAIRVMPLARPEPEEDPFAYDVDEDEKRARQALRAITVVRDSPQRLRVIRLTPAQRRAAQLLSGRFSVPAVGAGRTAARAAIAGRAFPDSFRSRRGGAGDRGRIAAARGNLAQRRSADAAAGGRPAGSGRPAADARRRAGARDGCGQGRNRSARCATWPRSARIWTRCSPLSNFCEPPERGDVTCEWLVEEAERALEDRRGAAATGRRCTRSTGRAASRCA